MRGIDARGTDTQFSEGAFMYPFMQRCVVAFVAAGALGYLEPALAGDRAKVSLEEVTDVTVVKKMPLEDVAAYFSDRHKVKFVLADGVPVDLPITGAVKGAKLRVALDILLKTTGLTYAARGDEIVIRRDETRK
jgi:hypothetical protein